MRAEFAIACSRAKIVAELSSLPCHFLSSRLSLTPDSAVRLDSRCLLGRGFTEEAPEFFLTFLWVCGEGSGDGSDRGSAETRFNGIERDLTVSAGIALVAATVAVAECSASDERDLVDPLLTRATVADFFLGFSSEWVVDAGCSKGARVVGCRG